MNILSGLFLVVLSATFGGIIAKLFKLPNLVGFIISGIFFGAILPSGMKDVASLSEIGTILLLFSIGLELSFGTLSKYLKISVFGSLIQIVLTAIFYFLIINFFIFDGKTALVLSLGFSLSSTAVLVKILNDKGEMDTIHGQIMMGWLLIQDLAVIPMMVALPVLGNSPQSFLLPLLISLSKALGVVIAIIAIGKIIIPYIIHRIAETNSRELLLLTSLTLAFGTATVAYLFGISPALGAFLAGVVISEGQENHAIFAETRPLRDLFMAIFFVTLGLSVNPSIIYSNIFMITILAVIVIVVKFLVVTVLVTVFGYKGKTAVIAGIGLSNVSEFAFVIFTTALTLNLLDEKSASLGISVSLLSLVASSILYKSGVPIWQKLKFIKMFSSGEGKLYVEGTLSNHVIICGYGRVGKWIGKAFNEFHIPFVVVEYNKSIVSELRSIGTNVFYGDPNEPEVMEMVGIKNAKLLILAIPDTETQEALISYTQTHAPNVKIISRVHSDTDFIKLKNYQIKKLVQPEFEASVAIVKSVLETTGKNRDEINHMIKKLRISHNK